MSFDLLRMEFRIQSVQGRPIGARRADFRFDEPLRCADSLVAEVVVGSPQAPIEVAYYFREQPLDGHKKVFNYFPLFQEDYERTNVIVLDAVVVLPDASQPWSEQSTSAQPVGVREVPLPVRIVHTPSPPKHTKRKSKREVSEFECRVLHFLRRNFRSLWRTLTGFVSGVLYETPENMALFKTLQLLAAFALSVERVAFAELLLAELAEVAPPQAHLAFKATLLLLQKRRHPETPLLSSLETLAASLHGNKTAFPVHFFVGVLCMEEALSLHRFELVPKISKQLRRQTDSEWPETPFLLAEAYYYAALASFRLSKLEKAAKYARLALKAKARHPDSRSSSFKFFELLTWATVDGPKRDDLMANYGKFCQQELEGFENRFSIGFFERWTNFRVLQFRVGDPRAASRTDSEEGIFDSLSSTFQQLKPLKYLLPFSFASVSRILLRAQLKLGAMHLRRGKFEAAAAVLKDVKAVFRAQDGQSLDMLLLLCDYKLLLACVQPGKTERARVFLQEAAAKARQAWGADDLQVRKIEKNIKNL